MVGAERKTIRRWLRAGGAPRWTKPRRVGMLGPYRDISTADGTKVATMRLSSGAKSSAWAFPAGLEPSGSGPDDAAKRTASPDRFRPARRHGQPPSTRRIARLLMTEDGNALPEAEQNFVSRLLGQVPSLAACVAVQRLSKLLRRKSKESLDDVLHDAAGTALKDFCAKCVHDCGFRSS